MLRKSQDMILIIVSITKNRKACKENIANLKGRHRESQFEPSGRANFEFLLISSRRFPGRFAKLVVPGNNYNHLFLFLGTSHSFQDVVYKY